MESAPAHLHTRNNTSVRYNLLHATMVQNDCTNSCQSRSFRKKKKLGEFPSSIQKFKDLDTQIYIFAFFFLYGCETWSFTLREGSRLRVFENRAMRRIFGPKRD